MPKLVMMPPQNKMTHEWAQKLTEQLSDYDVKLPETESDVRNEIIDADAIYGWIPPDLLPLTTKLRWLQSPQAGPPAGFYYPELIDHPVTVTNMRGVYNDHIAQHILMYVLALARGLPYYMKAQRANRWDPAARTSQYVDLIGATVLIVGVGGIGRETARLCHGLGMRVVGTDARWSNDSVDDVDIHPPADLDVLLPRADFVIVTVPHTPDTDGMWHKARFERMKETAYFINVGRGATTKLDDLTLALEDGIIAGCALDVYEVEPLPKGHKLWTLPNVILTPHIAVQDAQNISERQFCVFLENARCFAFGEKMSTIVDKALWF